MGTRDTERMTTRQDSDQVENFTFLKLVYIVRIWGGPEWAVCAPGVGIGRILGSHKEDIWQDKEFMSKRSRKGCLGD